MLRLLFCTAAILPIGLIPWITSDADTVPVPADEASYAELVTDPNLDALQDCDTGELPIFFQEGLVTSLSAEYIADGLQAAEGCGQVEVTVVPVLPEEAERDDLSDMRRHTLELTDYVEAAADISDAMISVDIAEEPREEEISTLYMNGRAAILHIDPKADAD